MAHTFPCEKDEMMEELRAFAMVTVVALLRFRLAIGRQVMRNPPKIRPMRTPRKSVVIVVCPCALHNKNPAKFAKAAFSVKSVGRTKSIEILYLGGKPNSSGS
jgi:hypothetical protein